MTALAALLERTSPRGLRRKRLHRQPRKPTWDCPAPFPMKGAPRAGRSDVLLLADAELANDVRVRLRLHAVEEVEQLPPPTDHGKEAAPAGVVLVVGPHVFRQAVDPGG